MKVEGENEVYFFNSVYISSFAVYFCSLIFTWSLRFYMELHILLQILKLAPKALSCPYISFLLLEWLDFTVQWNTHTHLVKFAGVICVCSFLQTILKLPFIRRQSSTVDHHGALLFKPMKLGLQERHKEIS